MLSEIFRAKMREALRRAGVDRDIDPAVWTRRWTVHLKHIGTGEHATRYLARYTYHVALSHHALEGFAHDHVTFRYTQARSHETRRQTLPVDVFIGRFLQHVLPRGFPKIRSYGLLSPSRRPALERARQLLHLHATPSTSTAAATIATPCTAHAEERPSAPLCPACQRGRVRLVERIRRSRAPP